MRLFINTIAFIVFILQFFVFVFSVLNLKKPENAIETLYNYFVFSAFLCSLITIAVFVIQYNCHFKLLKKKVLDSFFLIIVMIGMYVPIAQLWIFNDFILTSCLLLLIDCYVMGIILSNLFSKSNTL